MRLRSAIRALAALLAPSLVASPLAAPLAAQGAAPSRLTVERIVKSGDFTAAAAPTVQWLRDGRSYVDTRAAAGGGTEIVRVDVATGAATVLAPASALRDAAGRPIEVEAVTLSADERKALLFSGSVRVWRTNTRGVYHVVDFRSGTVTPIATITTPSAAASTTTDTADAPFLGKNERSPSFLARGLASGAADPELQMFAKFSPDGRSVAFVRGNNLWVRDLVTGQERQLTTDGSDDVINGTTDWVYEEELGLSDAFRWSPDSRRIAFWRFDQSAVPAFPMVDESSLYPRVSVLRYPKAGAPNARVRVGVVDVAASRPVRPSQPRWLEVGGDTGIYLARMEWVGNDSLTVLRLPRKQNQLDVLMLSAASGSGRTVLTERDSAYVDVEDQPVWLAGGRQFLWSSDRSGWRQLYLYDRNGSLVRQVTRDGVDVVGLAHVDERRGELYAVVVAPEARTGTRSQREVHRFSLDGKRTARVTREPGTHAVSVAPGGRYLVDSWSTASQPATATVYELPAMRRVRVLEDNAKVKANLAAAGLRAPEFFKLPVQGAELAAYRIVPAGFDSTRAYPVLMYVYGGPAAPTVNDAWGGTRYLWHQLLAQQGYVVVSVDNRGAAWRGRDFRKITQRRLGYHESEDQVRAARWLAAQRWVDPKRLGIWGWSFGGFLTTLTAAKGGDLFRAAIAVAPVTDWRLYDSIYTERFMWTPRENARGYEENAPLAHAKGIKARFLLVHGTGDDNVHPQNSTLLAARLQDAGVPFYMLLYPNQTHSISGGNSPAHLYESMTRFVMDNL